MSKLPGSHSIEVLGSQMSYLERGEAVAGAPTFLFIHGMPTSSFLWRHILDTVSPNVHCIAVDLIGMGGSDHPDIDYRVFDHIRYLEGFINALNLGHLILVMHAWGSVVGFSYAAHHSDKIKGLAFYESHVRASVTEDMLSLPVQELTAVLKDDHNSYDSIVEQDYLIEKLLPAGALNHLDDSVMASYRAPFPTPESRKPLWQYVHDLPLGHGPDDVVALISEYSSWLQQSDIPKLLMYSWPGFITTMETVMWAKSHLKNLTAVELGEAMHFAQETIPDAFSQRLLDWYQNI